jgi:hypothetical protein
VSRLVCLEPVRDAEVGDFGVRVLCDYDGVEIDFVGWESSLVEALRVARSSYPNAEVLEPTWAPP